VIVGAALSVAAPTLKNARLGAATEGRPYNNPSMSQTIVIGVGGFTSDVGKTTLLCELLKAFPGWEAIKTTRGHYRSCGKDPHACCVSHLLSEEPLVRSGRKETYEPGKDTGRYWDAGAANVHWLIATDSQVEKGIKQALARVKAPGVFVEGNSFSQFVDTDHFVMVRQAGSNKIKSSARSALNKATAIYVSDEGEVSSTPNDSIPLFTASDFPSLIEYLQGGSQWNRSIPF
jgi:molybdopterin-guanine dinucleotide biosynthesis protein